MDWEKTLNIFLIAFLALNLVFAAQLWLLPSLFNPANYISEEEVEAVLEKLQQSKINVTAKIPRRLTRLRSIEVRSLPLEKDEVAKNILGEAYKKTAVGPHVEYRSTTGTLAFYMDGHFHYQGAAPPMPGELSPTEARKAANQFLEKVGGIPADARDGEVIPLEASSWGVTYNQRWGRETLEISQITITVDGSGAVLTMDYYWVEVIGYVGEKMLTIPATTALTVIAGALPPDTTVTAVNLSWYSQPSLANQWQAGPAWVLETQTGASYYVNAHTGEFQGERSVPGRKTPAGVE